MGFNREAISCAWILARCGYEKWRDTDIVLFSMKFGEALASLAAAELSDFFLCLETMSEVVRIVRGRYMWCGWTLCVCIRGSV
jgi:hypothetical protein